MKDILIIAHFVKFNFEGGNCRFSYLADYLYKNGYNIELLTSEFSHTLKSKRDKRQVKALSYQVTLVDEPGYRKNVSLSRVWSHDVFKKKVKNYLKNRKKPDCIYCAVPSLGAAKEAALYAASNHIPFIIDVQDLWPEAFQMIFKIPAVSSLLFHCQKRAADYIYSRADGIVAVSQTYINRVMQVGSIDRLSVCAYLGTCSEAYINNRSLKIKKNDDEIWVAYAGTLGTSYNINFLTDSLCRIKKCSKRIRAIIIGDGPYERDFREYAQKKRVDMIFLGRRKYQDMFGILKKCDIAVNPIVSSSKASIINKVADYAAAGLPVISTQECEEYTQLLLKYNAGVYVRNGNTDGMANALKLLAEDEELRKELGENSKRLFDEKFDRSKTYPEIQCLLEKIINAGKY